MHTNMIRIYDYVYSVKSHKYKELLEACIRQSYYTLTSHRFQNGLLLELPISLELGLPIISYYSLSLGLNTNCPNTHILPSLVFADLPRFTLLTIWMSTPYSVPR